MRIPKEWRIWIRSPVGQMTILGWVFLGGLVFAVVCMLARDVFFERYVYEKFEPLPARLVDVGDVSALSPEDLRLLYGALVAEPDADLADKLLAADPVWFHRQIRGTLVTGDPEQREAATALLPLLWGHVDAAEVRATGELALKRATARDEPALARAARQALATAP